MLERDILVAQEASAAPTAASEPGAAQFKLAGPHCAPCGLARAVSSTPAAASTSPRRRALEPSLRSRGRRAQASSVCMGLVMILVGVVYVPMVINSTVRGPLAVLDVGIFHVLLLLLLASYLQAVFTDAGSTPAGWHDMIASQPETVRRNYKLCPKTHMYRPPRSHYDSVTRASAASRTRAPCARHLVHLPPVSDPGVCLPQAGSFSTWTISARGSRTQWGITTRSTSCFFCCTCRWPPPFVLHFPLSSVFAAGTCGWRQATRLSRCARPPPRSCRRHPAGTL